MISDSFLEKYRNKRILITPLNWGLGHATRCIPIIDQLRYNNKLFLASDGLALSLLQTEYPDLPTFRLPGLSISYRHSQMWLNALTQAQSLRTSIKADQMAIDQLACELSIDLIVSDHRLGCQNDRTENILVAHQLFIPHQSATISRMVTSIHCRYIAEFDECWVPDYPESVLSGKMSSIDIPIKKKFIGPLSRFEKPEFNLPKYDLGVILSGPEPQRAYLENKILNIARRNPQWKIGLVRGSMQPRQGNNIPDNLTITDLALTGDLQSMMSQSSVILSRCGYSTIMDLHKLDKHGILIPTPGQPEQCYLAKLHKDKGRLLFMNQSEISGNSISKALSELKVSSK